MLEAKVIERTAELDKKNEELDKKNEELADKVEQLRISQREMEEKRDRIDPL